MARWIGVTLLAVLLICGCSNDKKKVLTGTFYEKANLRRTPYAPMMVVPGKLTVFRFEAHDNASGMFNRTKFHDTIFLRFPEEVSEGLTLNEDFKSATAYYVCYSSFANWSVDPKSSSNLICTVKAKDEKMIVLDVTLNVELVSDRKELRTLEKSRRPLRGEYTYILRKDEISNFPRF